MTALWSSFYPIVQPHVPGCPEVVIDEHLQEAASVFCARSEVWRQPIEFGTTTAGVSTYGVDTPLRAVVENVPYVYLDGSLLRRSNDVYVEEYSDQGDGKPVSYTVYSGDQLKFFPTPDGVYTYRGLAVLRPKTDATGVEDFIYQNHRRAIACGAIASLTIIPNKEWTNPELAAFYAAKFLKDTDDAKGRDIRRTNLRVRGVGFA